MRRLRWAWAAVFAVLASAADSPGATVLFDMETLQHAVGTMTDKTKQKGPAGTAELVDGKVGKAVRFSFNADSSGGFMTARVQATPDWDKCDGFSFWVKGDGSDAWGGIELIDKSDFSLRYGYCFPIDSKDWKKITVRWSDLTPELAGPMVDAKSGYTPSRFGQFWFGKWFYWRDYPAHSYTIDQIELEAKINPPALPDFGPGGLERFRHKLKAKKPVTIVTLGDSLSDKRHWANRQTLWSELLAESLQKTHGSPVTLINPAVGGTTLSQNLVTMPKWLKQSPSPDLVIVWFGGNDWDNKVRGERFAEYLRTAVDRIRRETNGSADILLLTPCPAHARWETLAEFEKVVKDVAAEKKTGLADIASVFRKAGSADEALEQGYWVSDKVHLGPKGHEAARNAVMNAIAGQ